MHTPTHKTSILFIEGLKGYAALGVFFIHTASILVGNNFYLSRLVDFGKNGIILFFFLSAFTLCYSFERSKQFSYIKYLLRRYLKLSPMYYTIIFFAIAAYSIFNVPISDLSLNNILLHLTYTNVDFISAESQSNILGLEWTMPIMFFYYFLIPPLFFLGKRNRIMLYAVTFLGALILYNQKFFDQLYTFGYSGERQTIQNYLFTYCFAIATFILHRDNVQAKQHTGLKIIHIFSIIGIFAYLIFQSHSTQQVLLVIFGLVYLYITFFKSVVLSSLSSIKWLITNGETLFFLSLYFLWFIYKPVSTTQILTIFCSLFILSHITHPSILLKIIFENKIIVWIGHISYAIFLTQFVFLRIVNAIFPTNSILESVRFIFILILTFATSHFLTKLFNRFYK